MASDAAGNAEARLRQRAYRLWMRDGAPKGREEEYLERARELQAIEDNPSAGQLPNPILHPTENVEEAALMENLGEFPGRNADQGERLQTPMTRDQARRAASDSGH